MGLTQQARPCTPVSNPLPPACHPPGPGGDAPLSTSAGWAGVRGTDAPLSASEDALGARKEPLRKRCAGKRGEQAARASHANTMRGVGHCARGRRTVSTPDSG